MRGLSTEAESAGFRRSRKLSDVALYFDEPIAQIPAASRTSTRPIYSVSRSSRDAGHVVLAPGGTGRVVRYTTTSPSSMSPEGPQCGVRPSLPTAIRARTSTRRSTCRSSPIPSPAHGDLRRPARPATSNNIPGTFSRAPTTCLGQFTSRHGPAQTAARSITMRPRATPSIR